MDVQALIRGRLGLVKRLLLLLAALGISGCGGNSSDPVTEPTARQLAETFTRILTQSSNRRTAVRATGRIAEPAVVDDVQIWYEKRPQDTIGLWEEQLQPVSGPRSGCPRSLTQPFTVPKHGRCYRFKLVGKIVPDPINPGFGAIGFGTLVIWITPRRPARVEHYMYKGGFRECQLSINCSAARRAELRRARKASEA
jgi:hypothetical protein